jgi:hypothetical protein
MRRLKLMAIEIITSERPSDRFRFQRESDVGGHELSDDDPQFDAISDGVVSRAVSYIAAPLGSTNHGCALRVQRCVVGFSHFVLSKVPPRMMRCSTPVLGWGLASPQIQTPHCGHVHLFASFPVPRTAGR